MISKDKQYRCRNGCEWRYIETKDDKIIGAVKNQYGYWGIFEWNKNGSYSHSFCNDMDLVEVSSRIKREYWLALFDDGDVFAYPSEEEAKNGPFSFKLNLIAIVKRVVEFEEGEGL